MSEISSRVHLSFSVRMLRSCMYLWSTAPGRGSGVREAEANPSSNCGGGGPRASARREGGRAGGC